jgi:hypothetical protein
MLSQNLETMVRPQSFAIVFIFPISEVDQLPGELLGGNQPQRKREDVCSVSNEQVINFFCATASGFIFLGMLFFLGISRIAVHSMRRRDFLRRRYSI